MTMTTMYITCCAAVVFGLEGACINAQYVSSQILIRTHYPVRHVWPEIWFVTTAIQSTGLSA